MEVVAAGRWKGWNGRLRGGGGVRPRRARRGGRSDRRWGSPQVPGRGLVAAGRGHPVLGTQGIAKGRAKVAGAQLGHGYVSDMM